MIGSHSEERAATSINPAARRACVGGYVDGSRWAVAGVGSELASDLLRSTWVGAGVACCAWAI